MLACSSCLEDDGRLPDVEVVVAERDPRQDRARSRLRASRRPRIAKPKRAGCFCISSNQKWQLSIPFIAIYRKIFASFFAAVPHILPTYPPFPTKL